MNRYAEAVAGFKRSYLAAVLARHKGNQCAAARELEIHRNTLSRQLEALGWWRGSRNWPKAFAPRKSGEARRVA